MTPGHDIPLQHRRVVRALQSGGPAVPASVVERVEALHDKAAPRPARRAIRLPRPALAGGAAILAAIALVVALSLSSPGGASVADAAQLSALPSESPPPRGFAGVTYPDWSKRFGWFAVGGRNDELDGRRTTTAYYAHTHHRIGYTVISGKTIEPPDDAEVLNVDGLEMHRFRLGAQDVVTFERNGRTCVLSGKVHDPDTLVKLAIAE
jgi:hypothetical protein